MHDIKSICFFPIKGLGGFERDKCVLVTDELIQNDRKFALAEVPISDTTTPWLPKKHFKQLVNLPSLGKVSIELISDNPLILRINQINQDFNLSDENDKTSFTMHIKKLSHFPSNQELCLVQSIKGGLTDTKDQWISIGGTASANEIIEKYDLDSSYLRFRLNIWAATSTPFEEFNWIGRTGRIGEARLAFLAPVGRCNAINVSAQTGEVSSYILPQAMRTDYGHSNLGVFAHVVKSGKISTSDRLVID
ncbi:MOSC domain-containing protein [Alphaproteobacteria bacterium]|nr:MOSC domain-containing protein [Alphaproteobacteria bacterium]